MPRSAVRSLVLAFVLLPVCALAEPPAYEPFDIPQLNDMVIDGRADDWGDAGFRVEVLYPKRGKMVPAADFAPKARFAWDAEGLLVLMRVQDDAGVESPAGRPWSADSVELFAAGGVDSQQVVQLIVVPGRDAEAEGATGQAVLVPHDKRADRTVAYEPEAAATTHADGYTVEARLPWAALGVDAKLGTIVTADLQANDRDLRAGGQRYEMTWFTEGWAGRGPKFMHRLLLSDLTADPSTVVVGSRPGPALRGQRVTAFATADHAGQVLLVTRDGQTVAEPKLAVEGGYATADLQIDAAFETDAEGQPAYAVTAGDRLIHRFTAADRRAQVREQVESARLHLHPVFTGPTLPTVEFETPGWIEVLLGDYAAATVYYDADFNAVTHATRPGRYGAVTTIQAEGFEPIYRYTTFYRAEADEDIDWMQTAVDGVRLPEGLGLDPAVLDTQRVGIARLAAREFESRLNHDAAGGILLAGLHEADPESGRMHSGNNPWSADQAWWLALKKKLGHFEHRYHTYLPPGYDDPGNADKRWPMILFLHGSGERGSDPEPRPKHGPAVVAETEGLAMPFIVISPQCERNAWWGSPRVDDLLDELVTEYRIDESRVYLTGLSMGGYGSWYAASAHPERFAAVAPICGGGEPADAWRLRDVPIWTFHGDADELVPLERSQKMVEAITAEGGKHIALTVYPGVGHNSWSATYRNPKLYEWFLANQLGKPAVMPTAQDIAPPAAEEAAGE